MNLKEAFRYQNKLQSLMDEAQVLLGTEANVTRVENTHLRNKVMPEAENVTRVEESNNEYGDKINDVVGFLMFLLDKHEVLAKAVRAAKNSLPVDSDSEISLNGRRRCIIATLRRMSELRNSEKIIPNRGTGYRFNTDGDQVTYCCDVKRVTTINFDRNVVRKHLTELNRRTDAVSSEIDRCMVNAEVNFEPPFDVNDTFADALAVYLGKQE